SARSTDSICSRTPEGALPAAAGSRVGPGAGAGGAPSAGRTAAARSVSRPTPRRSTPTRVPPSRECTANGRSRRPRTGGPPWRARAGAGEGPLAGLERGRGGRHEPAEGARVRRAGSGEGEDGLGEVGAGDLRQGGIGSPLEVGGGVEAEADAGAGSSGPHRALC